MLILTRNQLCQIEHQVTISKYTDSHGSLYVFRLKQTLEFLGIKNLIDIKKIINQTIFNSQSDL